MQHNAKAQNTLNYSVQVQHNKVGLFVVFSFATQYNALTGSQSVTQRIAHCVQSLHYKATNADVQRIVARQQQLDNALQVCDYTSGGVCKLLCKNDEAAAQ